MPASSDRIVILARQPYPIFHTRDLARLWDIKNLNTLYTLLKRYTKKGILFRIYKGLYSLRELKNLDPMLLGVKALHDYAYVSTETILVEKGIMNQIIHNYTLISGHSRRFQIGQHSFVSRQMNDKFLYNTAGIIHENGMMKATLERAVADLLYFNPKAYFDGMKLIDFNKVRALQKEIGYPLTSISDVAS